MSNTQNTAKITTSWTRRLAAAAVLAAAPALIALGTATASHADATSNLDNLGSSMHVPVHHPAFPHQTNTPQPGTSIHHHHQNRHR